MLAPFADVVRRSFVSPVSEEWVGFKNYLTVFGNPAFRTACVNTARFIVACIPALLVLSLFIAVFLQRLGRMGGALKTAFLFPMAVPVASVALVWNVMFDKSGFVNGLRDALGIPAVSWMNSPAAFWVLVGSYIWKNLGYDVVLWLAALAALPSDMYEAARCDGAGEWAIFWRITLPCLGPSAAVVTVLSLLNSFKVFREAYLVAGNYPHTSMYLLQHLFNNWFRDLNFDRMAAGAVLMCLCLLTLILPLQRGLDREG